MTFGSGKLFYKDENGKIVPMGTVTGGSMNIKDGEPPTGEMITVQEDQTPDYVEPIVGWRAWELEEEMISFQDRTVLTFPPQPRWYLASLIRPWHSKTWKFKLPAMAECFCHEKNPFSQVAGESTLTAYSEKELMSFTNRTLCKENNCGLYALNSRQELMAELLGNLVPFMSSPPMRPLIVGGVNLWGTVDVHENGYRADYGYPMQLVIVHETFYDLLNSFSHISSTILLESIKNQLQDNYGVPVRIYGLDQLVREWCLPDDTHNILDRMIHSLHGSSLARFEHDGSNRSAYIAEIVRHLMYTLSGFNKMPMFEQPLGSSVLDVSRWGYYRSRY